MKNIDLNLMLLFLKVYKIRNLSKVSNTLGMSQPGVSLALGRLRDHFEDPLFVRTPMGMEPTDFAHALCPSIQQSADSLQSSLLFRMDFVPTESDRNFRIAMTEFGLMLFLPLILKQLSAVAPKVTLSVSQVTTEIENELTDGRIEIALSGAGGIKDYFYQQLLIESPLTGLVSRSHPEIGHEITQEQYERIGHVVVISPHGGQVATNRKLHSFGLRRRVALQLSSFTAYAKILQSTGYISILPTHIATVLARDGDIKLVGLPFELEPIAFRQYWHARQDFDLGHRWLRKLISTIQPTG